MPTRNQGFPRWPRTTAVMLLLSHDADMRIASALLAASVAAGWLSSTRAVFQLPIATVDRVSALQYQIAHQSPPPAHYRIIAPMMRYGRFE